MGNVWWLIPDGGAFHFGPCVALEVGWEGGGTARAGDGEHVVEGDDKHERFMAEWGVAGAGIGNTNTKAIADVTLTGPNDKLRLFHLFTEGEHDLLGEEAWLGLRERVASVDAGSV